MDKLDKPPGFENWPVEQRVHFVQSVYNRGEVIRGIREACDIPPEERGDPQRLTAKELGAVYEAVMRARG